MENAKSTSSSGENMKYENIKLLHISTPSGKKGQYLVEKGNDGTYISLFSRDLTASQKEKILQQLNSTNKNFSLEEQEVSVSVKNNAFIESLRENYSQGVQDILENKNTHISWFFQYKNSFGQLFFVSVQNGKVISVGERDQDVSAQQKGAIQRQLNLHGEKAFFQRYQNLRVQDLAFDEEEGKMYSAEYQKLYNLQVLFLSHQNTLWRVDVERYQKLSAATNFLKKAILFFPKHIQNLKVDLKDKASIEAFFWAIQEVIWEEKHRYPSEMSLRENLIGEFNKLQDIFLEGNKKINFSQLQFQKTLHAPELKENDRLFLYTDKKGEQFYILLGYHKGLGKKFISKATPVKGNAVLDEKESFQIVADMNNLTNYSWLKAIERNIFKNTLDYIVSYHKKQEKIASFDGKYLYKNELWEETEVLFEKGKIIQILSKDKKPLSLVEMEKIQSDFWDELYEKFSKFEGILLAANDDVYEIAPEIVTEQGKIADAVQQTLFEANPMYEQAKGQKETFGKPTQKQKTETQQEKTIKQNILKIREIERIVDRIESDFQQEIINIPSLFALWRKHIEKIWDLYKNFDEKFSIFAWEKPDQIIAWWKVKLMHKRLYKYIYPRQGEAHSKVFTTARFLEEKGFFQQWWEILQKPEQTQKKPDFVQSTKNTTTQDMRVRETLNLIQNFKHHTFAIHGNKIPNHNSLTHEQIAESIEFYKKLWNIFGMNIKDYNISFIHANIMMKIARLQGNDSEKILHFFEQMGKFLEKLDAYNYKKSAKRA